MKKPYLILSSSDNQMYIFDMPEKNIGTNSWYSKEYRKREDAYELLVQEDIANKVLVKDQRSALELLKDCEDYPNIKKDTPYPLSGYTITKQVCCDEYHQHTKPSCFLAILTPVKEEKPKIAFDSHHEEKQYFLKKSQFLKCCLDIQFIEKGQLDKLDSLYDQWTGKIKPVEGANNATAFKEDRITIVNPLPFILGDINQHMDRVLRDQGITMTKEVSAALMSFTNCPILNKFIEAGKTKLDEPTEGNGGWISVDSDIPKGSDIVFFISKSGMPLIGGYCLQNSKGSLFQDQHGNYHHGVKFWQYLPDTSKLTKE